MSVEAIEPELRREAEWDERVRRAGGAERERFVLAHAPLVRYVAQRIVSRLPSSVELSDLINDGLVGLIEAIDRYDPTRGVRFATFAEVRVRGAILDALRERDSASRSLRRKLRAMDSATSRAEQRLGRAPELDEVAAELGTSGAEVARLRREREASRRAPLDPRLSETSPDAGFFSEDPDPFELASKGEMVERLTALLGELPPREQLVLGLYYEDGLTLKEIGEVLSVTESRVCQIHTKSVRTLAERLGVAAKVARPARAGRKP